MTIHQQAKNIVCIDPDLHASGIAAWSNESQTWLFAKAVSIELVLSSLEGLETEETIIYVEAGWLVKKANFRGGNYRVAQAKARNVGENNAAGKLICKILRAAGYQVIEFKPLRKGLFKSRSGAWTKLGREYVQKESGLTHRMNDDVRDSIYTILHFRQLNYGSKN